jgi:hypothetical protein
MSLPPLLPLDATLHDLVPQVDDEFVSGRPASASASDNCLPMIYGVI